MEFSELKKFFKDQLGVDHLADIARELGVSAQAVSNWKARGRVPYKYVAKIRQKNQLNNLSKGNISAPKTDIMNKYHIDSDETSISLLDLVLIIAKQLRIIIFFPFIFSIIMIFYVQFIVESEYVSTAKVISSANNGSNNASQALGLAAQFGISLPSSNQGEKRLLYPDIIKSRTFAKSLLKRKFDTQKYGPQKTLLHIINNGIEINSSELYNKEYKSVDAILGMINVREDFETGICTIDVTFTDPKFACDIANAITDELDSYQREYNNSKISETRQFIEDRILQTEKDLRTFEEKLKNFRARNRRIENSPALLLEQQRLSREVAVLIGVFTTLKQQLETVKIEEVKESNYVIIIDPAEIPLNRSKPRKTFMVVLAGILGIGLGVFLGFIREFINHSDSKENDEKIKLIEKTLLNFIPFRKRR